MVQLQRAVDEKVHRGTDPSVQILDFQKTGEIFVSLLEKDLASK